MAKEKPDNKFASLRSELQGLGLGKGVETANLNAPKEATDSTLMQGFNDDAKFLEQLKQDLSSGKIKKTVDGKQVAYSADEVKALMNHITGKKDVIGTLKAVKMEPEDFGVALQAQAIISRLPSAANNPEAIAALLSELKALSSNNPGVQNMIGAAQSYVQGAYSSSISSLRETVGSVSEAVSDVKSAVREFLKGEDMSSASEKFMGNLNDRQRYKVGEQEFVEGRVLKNDMHMLHNHIGGRDKNLQILENKDVMSQGRSQMQMYEQSEHEAEDLKAGIGRLVGFKNNKTRVAGTLMGKNESAISAEIEKNNDVLREASARIDDVLDKQRMLINAAGSAREAKLRDELREAKIKLKSYLKENVAEQVAGEGLGVVSGKSVMEALMPGFSTETSKAGDKGRRGEASL